jgi:CO/xanthine dehydrogenase Mo-binding subunit
LKEQVQWNDTGITTYDWDTYPILNFDEVPEIELHLIEQPDQPSLGAGEIAAGPVPAAIGNALAHAIGIRARHLPLSPDRLTQLIMNA